MVSGASKQDSPPPDLTSNLYSLGENMSKIIILLNGPPKCGKDTIGNLLTLMLPSVELIKFAEPLRVFIKTTLGICDSELEATKDDFNPLFDMTIRQAMIAYSENFLKPTFGDSMLGRIAAQKIIQLRADVVVVTDSGFAGEARELVNEFGPAAVILVHLHREGTSFDGDSRSHIVIPYVTHREVTNNGLPVDAARRIMQLAGIAGAELQGALPTL
jgi:hypothetical protein